MGHAGFVISKPVKLGMVVGLCGFGVILIIFAVYRIRSMRRKYLEEKSIQQEREVYFGIEGTPPPHLDEETASALNKAHNGKSGQQNAINLDASLLWAEYQNRGSIWRDAFAEMPSPEPSYLSLSVYYQPYRKLLKVHVESAQHLRSAESGQSTLNTRVKITIETPSGIQPRKCTRIEECTNDPEYDEILSFTLRPEEVKNTKLQASVWRIDEFFREHLIGYVIVQLKDYELSKKTSILEAIRRNDKCDLEGGFLLVSICFQEEIERLSLIIFRARDLKSPTADTTPLIQQLNPYVRVHILSEGKIIKSGKTDTKADTANPTFNQLFQYTLTKEQLKTLDILMILLSENEALETREKLGKVLIGSHSAGSKKEQWECMLASDGKQIAQWHMVEQ